MASGEARRPRTRSRERETPKGGPEQRQRDFLREGGGRKGQERRFFKLERVEAAIEGNGRGGIDRVRGPRKTAIRADPASPTGHDSLEKKTENKSRWVARLDGSGGIISTQVLAVVACMTI
jgi:hypothetical protein